MKKHGLSTIALAVAALLLSGNFAAAGEYSHISQNDNDNPIAPTPVMAGNVIDIDQLSPRGGGSRGRYLVKPRPKFGGGVIDIDQLGPRGGGSRGRQLVKPRSKFDGGVIDIDQLGPRGGGSRGRQLVKPRPTREESMVDGLTGICLNATIFGRVFCWGG